MRTPRIYTLPDELPKIFVEGAGKKAIELAARAGDGLISVAPQKESIETFLAAGGRGKPRLA